MPLHAITSRPAIQTIVFATDFSERSRRALPHAAALARQCHARLILSHVLTSVSPLIASPEVEGEGSQSRLESQVKGKLEGVASSENIDDIFHETVVSCGEVWNGLSQIVESNHVDLVVLGTRGITGVRKLKLGSTAEDVTRTVPCPVMIIGPRVSVPASGDFGQILCATRFDEGSMHALERALPLMLGGHRRLTLLHVLRPENHVLAHRDQVIRQCTERMLSLVPEDDARSFEVSAEVRFGKPAEEIVERARAAHADLIVMGARAAGRASTFLPSTLHQVISNAPCPVLTMCCG